MESMAIDAVASDKATDTSSRICDVRHNPLGIRLPAAPAGVTMVATVLLIVVSWTLKDADHFVDTGALHWPIICLV